jgi:hypothetical protein
MKRHGSQIIYSPSDLVRYAQSPFASWMDRYYLENRNSCHEVRSRNTVSIKAFKGKICGVHGSGG